MVIDDIKRMRWSHLRAGATGPGKITMSRKTFIEMTSNVRELMCVDAGDHPEWTVCGMQIEVRDDADPEVMFIIS